MTDINPELIRNPEVMGVTFAKPEVRATDIVVPTEPDFAPQQAGGAMIQNPEDTKSSLAVSALASNSGLDRFRSRRTATVLTALVLPMGIALFAPSVGSSQEAGPTSPSTPDTPAATSTPIPTPNVPVEYPGASSPAPVETPASAPIPSIVTDLSIKDYPFKNINQIEADFEASKSILSKDSFPNSFKFFVTDQTAYKCEELGSVSNVKVGSAGNNSVRVQLNRSNKYYSGTFAYNPNGTDNIPPHVVPEADELSKLDYSIPCNALLNQGISVEMWGLRNVAGRKVWAREPGTKSVKLQSWNPDLKFNKFGQLPLGLPVKKSDPLSGVVKFPKGRKASDKTRGRYYPALVFTQKFKPEMMPSRLKLSEYKIVSVLGAVSGKSKKMVAKDIVHSGRGSTSAVYTYSYTRRIK